MVATSTGRAVTLELQWPMQNGNQASSRFVSLEPDSIRLEPDSIRLEPDSMRLKPDSMRLEPDSNMPRAQFLKPDSRHLEPDLVRLEPDSVLSILAANIRTRIQLMLHALCEHMI